MAWDMVALNSIDESDSRRGPVRTLHCAQALF
eukprot:COSAG01_NODE_59815_length_298_cov_0.738693_1_plen_31_part_10